MGVLVGDGGGRYVSKVKGSIQGCSWFSDSPVQVNQDSRVGSHLHMGKCGVWHWESWGKMGMRKCFVVCRGW